MAKRELTDRLLRSLKAAPSGKRYDVMDSVVPGLAVRVTATGHKSFVLVARFPGSDNPVRRAIGDFAPVNEAVERRRYLALPKAERERESFDDYLIRSFGTATLAGARARARQWSAQLRSGIDPREGEERRRAEQKRARESTFAAVAEEFIARHLRDKRRGGEVERAVRREFIARWGKRPITSITRADVLAVIDAAVDRGSPYQAHNLLGYVRLLFNWAIERGVYGVNQSPCDRMKPRRIIGEKQPRSRILDDAELRALWRVSATLGYPYGPILRLLALTGQRKSEVAEARWAEFDLAAKRWTIPAERMKMDAPHVVPLSDAAVELLHSLPRFKRGDHVFSNTAGATAVNGFSKAKLRVDTAVEKELGAEPPPFVIHDIRRSVRTRLSAFTSSDVAELIIAHARPGLRRVYDLHSFEDEKRAALDAWAARLRAIVEPPPNVVDLAAARADHA